MLEGGGGFIWKNPKKVGLTFEVIAITLDVVVRTFASPQFRLPAPIGIPGAAWGTKKKVN